MVRLQEVGMRRDVALAGLGFWLLVSALVAFLAGRAHADATVAAIAPAAPAAPMSPAAPVARVAAVVPAAPVATAAPVAAVSWGQFHGQVLFSDVMIAAPAQFPSDAAMSEALRRLKRTTVEGGAEGFWRLHMVAFLDPAPQIASFRLRATDVTDPKDRHEVRMFEVDGLPGQKELAINDLVVTEVMGFERGHRYEIAVISRGDDLPAGKGDVYATGVITLM
jgi:hypothetical protein